MDPEVSDFIKRLIVASESRQDSSFKADDCMSFFALSADPHLSKTIQLYMEIYIRPASLLPAQAQALAMGVLRPQT